MVSRPFFRGVGLHHVLALLEERILHRDHQCGGILLHHGAWQPPSGQYVQPIFRLCTSQGTAGAVIMDIQGARRGERRKMPSVQL